MSASNGTAVLGTKPPEVEVLAKATRRRFSAEYKLRILREAEACTRPGELGALLRREGLYSSNLTTWRAQRERGELLGLTPKRRGPAPKAKNPLAAKMAALAVGASGRRPKSAAGWGPLARPIPRLEPSVPSASELASWPAAQLPPRSADSREEPDGQGTAVRAKANPVEGISSWHDSSDLRSLRVAAHPDRFR